MKKDSLKPSQITTIIVSSILGVDILFGTREAVSIASQDAWISVLIGGLLCIISGSIGYYLNNLYPDNDLPEIFLLVGGKFLGRILIILIITYTLSYTALSSRLFAQALKMFLLDRTPMLVIVALLVLIASYTVYKGIYTLSNVVDIIFPIGVVTFILFIALSLSECDISELKPVLFENSLNVLKCAISSYKVYSGYGAIGYIFCYLEKKKGAYKYYLVGLIISIVFITTLTAITIMAFGVNEIKSLVFPTLILSKSIEFPSTFVERLESSVAVFGIITVYLSLAIFLFVAIRNINVLFSIPCAKRKYTVWFILPIIIFIAMYEKSGLKVFDYFNFIRNLMLITTAVIIPIFTVYAAFKKKKELRK